MMTYRSGQLEIHMVLYAVPVTPGPSCLLLQRYGSRGREQRGDDTVLDSARQPVASPHLATSNEQNLDRLDSAHAVKRHFCDEEGHGVIREPRRVGKSPGKAEGGGEDGMAR